MRLFGDLLPFVGFRLLDRAEMAERDLLGRVAPSPVDLWQAFELEWLGEGLTLAVRPLLARVD